MEELLVVDDDVWRSSVVDEILAEAEELRDAISGDFGLSPVAHSRPKPKTKTKTKRSRNSTRDRRQSEAQFLRRHIAELEDELKKMQRDGVEAGIVGRPRGIVSAWQRLAQRQQMACAHSERENATLRRQVMQRALQIRRIQELLYSGRTAGSLGIPRVPLVSEWDDGMVFAELKRQAVIAFSRTDQVLEEHSRAIDMADGNRVTRDFDATRCQIVANLASTFTFPFDIHSTSTALWGVLPSLYFTQDPDLQVPCAEDMTEMTHRCQDNAVHIEEHSDSLYAVSYVAQLTVDGVVVSVRVRDVIMQFESMDKSNKSVIVWQTAHGTNTHASYEEMSISPVISSGWLVMNQHPGECRSTVLESVFQFRSPSTIPTPPNQEQQSVMETWIKLAEGCVDKIVLQVDKKLLE